MTTVSRTRLRIAKEFGTDLSSRSRAATLRKHVESLTASGAKVVLDFEGVRTISHSFADEAIALLVIKKGRDWFASTISIASLTENVRLAILEAIASRNRVSHR